MIITIYILFTMAFFLLLNFLFKTLFHKGFTFKLGLAFGVLYFIFIPVGILLLTGKVNLVKTDFGITTLTDVFLKKDTKASLILISYIFSLIFYLYFFKVRDYKKNKAFTPKLKQYFIVYFASLFIILVGSGLLKGGNWYEARYSFMVKNGALAILLLFVINAAKILIISSIIYLWTSGKLNFKLFLLYIISFTLFDMIVSGNRIYLFSTFVIIGLIFLKRYPLKILISLPFLVPLIYYIGYFASLFRHMRVPLFAKGIPTFEVFKNTFARAVRLDPPNLTSFFLNISESVNFNVIYNIINHYDKSLYGATYFKIFVYFVPRSIWAHKPESITKITADFFGSASLVTTIFGELHMNFSYLGIFLLPLILYLTESLLSYFKYNSPVFNYILFIMGLLFFRMPFSDELLTYLILVFMVYVFNVKFVFKKAYDNTIKKKVY